MGYLLESYLFELFYRRKPHTQRLSKKMNTEPHIHVFLLFHTSWYVCNTMPEIWFNRNAWNWIQ